MSEITLERLDARPFVGIRREVAVTQLAAYFSEVLPKVMGWVAAQGIQPASMPMAMWCAMDPTSGVADCHAGCFVHSAVAGDGEITAGETAAGEVLVVTHTGPYTTVGEAWQAIYAEAARRGRTPGAGWEIYLNDPGSTPAAELQTRIHLPLMPA
jgi:effector-binding domain-containing protein